MYTHINRCVVYKYVPKYDTHTYTYTDLVCSIIITDRSDVCICKECIVCVKV